MKEIVDGGKHVGDGGKHVGESKECVALATFKNGKYQNRATGNHAVIFLEYGEKDGKRGMWVLDQSKDKAPSRRFRPFGGNAELCSVIRRRRR